MRTTRYVIAAVAMGVIAAVAFAAVAGAQPAKKQATQLSGAGSTFVAPLIGQWINNYKDASITYNPVGSGAGITAVSGRTVDFGASDAPMTVDQFANCQGCVMVPWALSGSAILYNLPGVKNNIHLTGSVVADMYLGKISKWSDPKIRKLNPGVSLPDTTVTPVYRSDGSGTTFNVTDFLSASNKTSSGTRSATTRRSTGRKGVGARGSAWCLGRPHPHAGSDRLRRHRVRAREQAAVRGGPERVGQVGPAGHPRHQGRRAGRTRSSTRATSCRS